MERKPIEHKAPISGPLVHWIKVQIIKSTMKALYKANVVARSAAIESEINGDPRGKAIAETIIKTNATNLIKANELIHAATIHVPNEWRFWPSLN